VRAAIPLLTVVALFDSPEARACSITHVAPTGTVPSVSMRPERFRFAATDDCRMLFFSSQSGLVTKLPTREGAVGPRSHGYSVALTDAESDALFASSFETLTWSVTGQDAMGVDTRVATTNEIDVDGDGWTRTEGDLGECDESEAQNPGRRERPDNGVDDDCDGVADGIHLTTPDAAIRTHVRESYLGRAMAVDDVSGDGVLDVLSAAPDGLVNVFPGPIDGDRNAGDAIVIATTLAYDLAARDADGDAVGDVLVGGDEYAYLFHGPITGSLSEASADASIVVPARALYASDVAEDVDGDGLRDLILKNGSAGPARGIGAVYVFAGSLAGTVDLTSATYTFTGAAEGDVGNGPAVGVPDLNGDGIGDLALDAVRGDPPNTVYLIDGGLAGGTYDPASIASAILASWSTGSHFGDAVIGTDYDGDGNGDVIVASDSSSSGSPDIVVAFLGPFAGRTYVTDGDATWEPPLGTVNFGAALASGDVDGDDQTDLLMRGDEDSTLGGIGARLQLGFVEGTVDSSTLPSLAAPDGYFSTGRVGLVADWDGDGGDELLLGSPYEGEDSQGAIYVYSSGRLF
jgi:hypothetical protein